MRGGRQVGGPLLKRMMSRTAGLSLHWFGGLPIHDATSNFRLYSKRLLNQVTIESQGGFELGLELTVKPYRFGFVDGYGKEWTSATARRALIEAVMAFNGGSGAKKALTALEATDKADTNYKHSDTITGIDPYYGAHFTSSGAFEDEFVFVKGNDLFLVIVAG